MFNFLVRGDKMAILRVTVRIAITIVNSYLFASGLLVRKMGKLWTIMCICMDNTVIGPIHLNS